MSRTDDDAGIPWATWPTLEAFEAELDRLRPVRVELEDELGEVLLWSCSSCRLDGTAPGCPGGAAGWAQCWQNPANYPDGPQVH